MGANEIVDWIAFAPEGGAGNALARKKIGAGQKGFEKSWALKQMRSEASSACCLGWPPNSLE